MGRPRRVTTVNNKISPSKILRKISLTTPGETKVADKVKISKEAREEIFSQPEAEYSTPQEVQVGSECQAGLVE